MKVVGAGKVVLGRPEDEVPQQVGTGELWQESMAMNWFDPERGVGGVNRIGHEPNMDGGRVVLWNTIFTLHGLYYKAMDILPLRPGDRLENGLNAGETTKYRFDKQCHWRLRDVGVDMDVRFFNHHQSVSNIPLREGDQNVFYSGGDRGHIDAAGRVRGTLVVGDRRYQVDGSGYRNHSWGVRNWHQLRSHRWVAGECGKDFSFAVFSWHAANGGCESHGHVVRDGVMIFAEKVDIIVYTDIDSISHRGCVVHMTLPGGEILRFDVEPICKGTMGHFHDTLVPLTSPCTVKVDGREGICSFETSVNILGGREFPAGVINGVSELGLVKVPDWKPVAS